MVPVVHCVVVTDDWVGARILATRDVPSRAAADRRTRVHGPACDVLVVLTPDLGIAVSLVRGAEERGRHARLHADRASAHAFAEALTAGRVPWKDR